MSKATYDSAPTGDGRDVLEELRAFFGVRGEQMIFAGRWPDLEDAVARLAAANVLPQPALRLAQGLLAQGPPGEGLLWTHIHGDARRCHLLFEGERLVAVVDHDAEMWGERPFDLAFALISHPDTARVAFLDIAAIRGWLARYQGLFLLTDKEIPCRR